MHDDEPINSAPTTEAIGRRNLLWSALTGPGALREVVVPLAMFNLGCIWQSQVGGAVWQPVTAAAGWYVVSLGLGAALRTRPRSTVQHRPPKRADLTTTNQEQST